MTDQPTAATPEAAPPVYVEANPTRGDWAWIFFFCIVFGVIFGLTYGKQKADDVTLKCDTVSVTSYDGSTAVKCVHG